MRRRGGSRLKSVDTAIFYTYSESYSTEYEAVLDKAIVFGIPIPSPTERTRQNNKMVNLVNSGIFAKLDAYFEFAGYVEAIAFRKLDWKRLILGDEINFPGIIWDNEGGTGNEVNTQTGGAFDLNYKSADYVNFQGLNGSIGFKTNFFSFYTIGGRESFNSNQVHIYAGNGGGAYNPRLLINQSLNLPITPAVKTYISTNKDGKFRQFEDGLKIHEENRTSVGIMTHNLYAWGLNNGGTLFSGNGQLSNLFISQGLTDSEAVTMDGILNL